MTDCGTDCGNTSGYSPERTRAQQPVKATERPARPEAAETEREQAYQGGVWYGAGVGSNERPAEPETPWRLVQSQAEDARLWFEAQTAPEAYLQQELRRLHAAVERQHSARPGTRERAAAPQDEGACAGWTVAQAEQANETLAEASRTIASLRAELAVVCGRYDAARAALAAYCERVEGARGEGT